MAGWFSRWTNSLSKAISLSPAYEMTLAMENDHQQRLADVQSFLRFYLGKQWAYASALGESQVTVNMVRALIDLQVGFMFRKGWSNVIPDDPDTTEDEKKTRAFILSKISHTWKCNRQIVWGVQAGQMCAVTGDLFAKVSWNDLDPIHPAYAAIEILPSTLVFPTFNGPYGVDGQMMASCTVIYPRLKSGGPFPLGYSVNTFTSDKVYLYVEQWFPDRVIVWDDEIRSERPNPLGEIPIVHVPNYPSPGRFYGISDVVSTMELQKQYNEKSTDVSDTINYQGAPTVVLTGVRAAQLERGPDNVWCIPEGAKAETLGLKDSDLKSSVDYLATLRSLMHELSSVPVGALGQFPNVTSGSIMSMIYTPLVSRCEVKSGLFGYGLQRINRLVLRYNELMDSEFSAEFSKQDIKNRYYTEIVFPEFLPRDETIELARSQQRLQSKLTSRKWERAKVLGISQAENDQIEEEIAAEAAADIDSGLLADPNLQPATAAGPAKKPSGNPNPKRPNPDVQSEKRSTTVQSDASKA